MGKVRQNPRVVQHWTRMVLGLFTLFVDLSWPKKKFFPLIIANTLIEDMGTVLSTITKETEAPGKLLPFTEASIYI